MEKTTKYTGNIFNEKDKKFITISTPYYTSFMSIVNGYLDNNYELISANCGILKKDGDENQIWQAILLLKEGGGCEN